jgi:hypothetical protein
MRLRAGPDLWSEVLRWGLGVAAMMATWGLGFWKTGTLPWKWLLLGPVVLFATVGALSMPAFSAVVTVAAFLFRIDDGLAPAIRTAAWAFLLVGLLLAGWQAVRSAARRSVQRGG